MALEMEGQTVRGPELRLAGLPAQQVSEEGPGFKSSSHRCAWSSRNPPPRVSYSAEAGNKGKD